MVWLVWYVWFGLVSEDDLKRPLVPLKVAKFSPELHLGTIPGRLGWVGSDSDYKAISVQLQMQLPAGTELRYSQCFGQYLDNIWTISR